MPHRVRWDVDTDDSGNAEAVAIMAAHVPSTRFALRAGPPDHQLADGAWWPESRSLADQLGQLFASWPTEQGRIQRVLYSPPDWDDRPRSVDLPGRYVKVGNFPRDDTHELVLSMGNGIRRRITVIPPDTSPEVAERMLADLTDPQAARPAGPDGPEETERPAPARVRLARPPL